MNQTLLENLHLGLDRKNSGCGPRLLVSYEVGRQQTNSLKVAITSAIGQSTSSLNQSIEQRAMSTISWKHLD